MKNFLLLVALILSFAFDNAFAAAVTDDPSYGLTKAIKLRNRRLF